MSLILDGLEDMQLLTTRNEESVSSEVLNDKRLASVLSVFDLVSSGNLSCCKIPQPDGMDTCRDVMEIVIDSLESIETSDTVLTQLERLRFLLSLPHFQVTKFIQSYWIIAYN